MTWKDEIRKIDEEYPNPNFSIGQAEDLVSRAFNLLKKDLESEDKAISEFQAIIYELLEKYNIYTNYSKR